MELKQHLNIDDILYSDNVAESMDADDLDYIGECVFNEYENDKNSRSEWETRYADAMEMAMQVTQQKTFPWPNASNVKFPLITIAALQYHARAYPALVPGENVVKARIIGEDTDGSKMARAKRVTDHMDFQVTEEDTQWEESMDKLLLVQPILGSAFKKTYFDTSKGHNVSELVFPKDLVVNYYTTSLETASRVTHVVYLTRNQCYERQKAGLFCEFTEGNTPTPPKADSITASRDQEQGITPPPLDADTPYTILEQHRLLDLDGDGYAEPYIVWLREDTKQVLRIVARFLKENVTYTKDGVHIQSIKAEHFFTKFPFIPSPDGGFYDMGFGLLLGSLNHAIDTAINQMVDQGTMYSTSGGFLSRGVRVRGGDYTFRPNEFKRTDTSAEELAKGIVPLPTREPSGVLFQLLGLLIEYGTKIGMATDPLVGQNPGQNTPAETSRNTIVQGEKVFNGIYKRTYRSLKEEFRKLYHLNYLYADILAPNGKYEYGGGYALYEDYFESDKSIVPAADPNVSSETQQVAQATTVFQLSANTPGFDRYQATKRLLSALKVSDIEQIFPDPKGPNAIPPQPNPKVLIEQAKEQTKQLKIKTEKDIKLAQLSQEAELQQVEMAKLEAEAILALAKARETDNGHAIALLNTMLGAAKQRQEGVLSMIQVLLKQKEVENNADSTAMGRMAKPKRNAGVSGSTQQGVQPGGKAVR